MADRSTHTAYAVENAPQGGGCEIAGHDDEAGYHKPKRINVRLRKEAPTITVHLSQEYFDQLHQLAHRTGGSVSQITLLAILRLLNDVEKGVIPVLPEFRTGIEPGHA